MRPLRVTLLAVPVASTSALRFGAEDVADATTLARWQEQGVRLSADLVLRSPSHAAAETADCLGLTGGARVDPDLQDRGHGVWAGRTLDSVAGDDEALFTRWLNEPGAAPAGGESAGDLIARAARWLGEPREPARHVLALTHPALVRALLVAALGIPAEAWFRLDAGHGCRTELTRTGANWRLRRFNAAV